MKTLTTLRSAALATFAVAAISLPTVAQARDYNDCSSKSQEEQLVAGLIGAVIGGVAGSQISGDGARTEGSAIGAIAGGIAGAAIADGQNDCDKIKRRGNNSYDNRSYGSRTVYQPTRTRGYNNRNNNGYRTAGYNQRGYRNNGYNNGSNRRNNRGYNNRRNDRGYNNRRHNGYNNSYGYNSGTRAQLEDVRYRLMDLRKQNRTIERHLAYYHNDYDLLQRQERVCNEILRLEKKERRLKRRLRGNNNYR